MITSTDTLIKKLSCIKSSIKIVEESTSIKIKDILEYVFNEGRIIEAVRKNPIVSPFINVPHEELMKQDFYIHLVVASESLGLPEIFEIDEKSGQLILTPDKIFKIMDISPEISLLAHLCTIISLSIKEVIKELDPDLSESLDQTLKEIQGSPDGMKQALEKYPPEDHFFSTMLFHMDSALSLFSRMDKMNSILGLAKGMHDIVEGDSKDQYMKKAH